MAMVHGGRGTQGWDGMKKGKKGEQVGKKGLGMTRRKEQRGDLSSSEKISADIARKVVTATRWYCSFRPRHAAATSL